MAVLTSSRRAFPGRVFALSFAALALRYRSHHTWQPELDFDNPQGGALIFPPGYMHESMAHGKCSTSTTYQVRARRDGAALVRVSARAPRADPHTVLAAVYLLLLCVCCCCCCCVTLMLQYKFPQPTKYIRAFLPRLLMSQEVGKCSSTWDPYATFQAAGAVVPSLDKAVVLSQLEKILQLVDSDGCVAGDNTGHVAVALTR